MACARTALGITDVQGADSAVDFICWGLTHAKKSSIPDGASLALPLDECSTEPWEYLYGTTGRICTQALLDEKYDKYYRDWGWSRSLYNKATAGWVENSVIVCDCQGLLDAYCTQVLGVKTDIRADDCYTRWCTDKGRIRDISRAYVIGEAVFRANDYGTMKHVGWVCGFASDGEPLVLEERGLSYGCVVTRLSGRGWTHRGLMTVRFAYDIPSPVQDAFYAVCSGGSVNVRSGRGTDQDVLTVLHAGDLLLALPEENGWCEIAYAENGTMMTGFMSKKYVEGV